MAKNRKYSDEYLKLGFTSVISKGIEKPQCVLCSTVLGAEALKPSKLKRHLEAYHPQHKEKDLEFFRRHEASLKRQRLDVSGASHQQNAALVQASYEIALEIANQKKPHTIGETLLKPCLLKAVKLVLGESSEKKMQNISLSNNTVQRRISDMSLDVKEQIVREIKASPMFAFQLDESTDVSSCSQLLVFVKYVHTDDIKEEFLFCSSLETTTKAEDVMKLVSSFFQTEGLEWKKLCGVCTDGAPSMLGSKSGFQSKVKELAPQAKGIHCVIHRYALASKTLPPALQEVLDFIVKIVNYIKSSALNSRMFKELCKGMNSDHEMLLYYTSVRWLSKGNVVNRFFELRREIKCFLELRNRQDLAANLDDVGWIMRAAYLADIFDKMNQLNVKLQGKDTNIINFNDSLMAFSSKLQNWHRKVNIGNVSMFENLSGIAEEYEAIGLEVLLKEQIASHLESLQSKFDRYFPDLTEEESGLVRNPFSSSLDISSIPDEIQDEFLDLQNDSSARDLFLERSLAQFWCSMYRSYPNVSTVAFRVLVPFASTYLCEAGFSALFHIKTRTRNMLKVEHDMRLALTKTKPRIDEIIKKSLLQPSH